MLKFLFKPCKWIKKRTRRPQNNGRKTFVQQHLTSYACVCLPCGMMLNNGECCWMDLNGICLPYHAEFNNGTRRWREMLHPFVQGLRNLFRPCLNLRMLFNWWRPFHSKVNVLFNSVSPLASLSKRSQVRKSFHMKKFLFACEWKLLSTWKVIHRSPHL